MIAGGNWWRANEIVIRHLTRRTATRYRCRDRAPRMLVAIALANKMARSIWAILTKGKIIEVLWLLPSDPRSG
jgi:hypothetical protein